MALIYLCKNTITEKAYIGCTIRPLNERKWEHIRELNSGKKGGVWQEEYNQYGKSALVFTILHNNVPIIDLLDIEDQYICKYNCLEPLGYNKKLNNSSIRTNRDYLATSKLPLDQIRLLISDILCNTPYLSTKELADKYGYTTDGMQDIIRCKSHRWFADFFPEEYNEIEKIHESGLERKSYLDRVKILQALCLYIEKDNKTTDTSIAEQTRLTLTSVRDLFRGKAFTWAKNEFPLEYTLVREKYSQKNAKNPFSILDTVTGETRVFSSMLEAEQYLNIDRRRISELLAGKRVILINRFVLNP